LGRVVDRKANLKFPAWHAEELAKTQAQLAEGKEQILDWEVAKKKLRKRFE